MGDAPTLIRIGVQYAGKDACIELLVADGDTPEREAVARELRELSAATVPIEAGMEGEPPFHAGQQFTADVKRIMQKVKTARNERASRMVKQVDRDADAGLGTRRSLQNRPDVKLAPRTIAAAMDLHGSPLVCQRTWTKRRFEQIIRLQALEARDFLRKVAIWVAKSVSL